MDLAEMGKNVDKSNATSRNCVSVRISRRLVGRLEQCSFKRGVEISPDLSYAFIVELPEER
jgi:hypothetical protein